MAFLWYEKLQLLKYHDNMKGNSQPVAPRSSVKHKVITSKSKMHVLHILQILSIYTVLST